MGDPRLPDFSRPPVVETVLSVGFREIPRFGLAQIIRFWERELAERLPEVEERPRYEMPVERFGGPEAESLELTVGERFPSPRLWFSAGNDLVQMQSDWFAYNWRQADPTDDYTRYTRNREQFREQLSKFVEYVEQEVGGRFVPSQCEVTYVNHIALEEEDLSIGPLGQIFVYVQPRAGAFLPTPDTARFATSYIIPHEHGRPVGRLHVQVERGWSKFDRRPLVLMNLTARGRPLGEGVDGALKFCDLGHGWVVSGFKDLTSKIMHLRWGLKGRERE